MSQEAIGTQVTGYLLALGSAAAIATAFVVRKAISTRLNPVTFSVWWYGLAGAYAWLFAILQGQTGQVRGVRQAWRPLLGLALLNAVAAILYFTEIDMTNPALVAFFGRMRTVYTILLGMLFLGERLNRREWAGAGMAVLGTLIIAYRGGTVLNAVLAIALVENLLMAATTIMAKSAVRFLPPIVLAGVRGLAISLLLLGYALLRGQWQWTDARTLAFIAGGAFVSPFLGYVLRYGALARADAGKVAIVTAIEPAFVTLYTAILFRDLPTLQQGLGGTLAIVGVVSIFRARQATRSGGN